MKTKLLSLIALFFIAALAASCDKSSEEQPLPNTLTAEGVEQNVSMIRYGFMQYVPVGGREPIEKAGFRISTATSERTFDPTKDVELYLEINARDMSQQGIKAINAKLVQLKIKDVYCNSYSGSEISEGFIIIKLGSNDQAEIKLNIQLRKHNNGTSPTSYHRVECQFKGKMTYADKFGAI